MQFHLGDMYLSLLIQNKFFCLFDTAKMYRIN